MEQLSMQQPATGRAWRSVLVALVAAGVVGTVSVAAATTPAPPEEVGVAATADAGADVPDSVRDRTSTEAAPTEPAVEPAAAPLRAASPVAAEQASAPAAAPEPLVEPEPEALAAPEPAAAPAPAPAPTPAPAPAPAPAPPTPAAPAPPAPTGNLASAEARHAWDLLNGVRASHGLPALTLAADAIAKAQALASELAAAGRLFHSSSLFGGLDDRWRHVVENVGSGTGVEHVHALLVADGAHLQNMLSPGTAGGVGTATGADGQLYVVQILVG